MNLTKDQLFALVSVMTSSNDTEPAVCSQPCQTKRQIVIGERGWVWVGDVHRDGGDYVVKNASCIRVWGTTNGLGELALKGKQSKTVLDPCGTVSIPELAVIGRIDVAPGVAL